MVDEEARKFDLEVIQNCLRGIEKEKEFENMSKAKNKEFYQLFLDSEKQKEKLKAQTREQLLLEEKKIVKEALRLDEFRDNQKESFKKMMIEKLNSAKMRNTKSQNHSLEQQRLAKENKIFIQQVIEGERKYILNK